MYHITGTLIVENKIYFVLFMLTFTVSINAQDIDSSIVEENKILFNQKQLNALHSAINLQLLNKNLESRKILLDNMPESEHKSFFYALLGKSYKNEKDRLNALGMYIRAHEAVDSLRRDNYPVCFAKVIAEYCFSMHLFKAATNYFNCALKHKYYFNYPRLYFEAAYNEEKALNYSRAYKIYINLLLLDPGADDIWNKKSALEDSLNIKSNLDFNIFKNFPDSVFNYFTLKILPLGNPNNWVRSGYTKSEIINFTIAYEKMHNLLENRFIVSADQYQFYASHNIGRFGHIREMMGEGYKAESFLPQAPHSKSKSNSKFFGQKFLPTENKIIRDSLTLIAERNKQEAFSLFSESLEFFSFWESNLSDLEPMDYRKLNYRMISKDYYNLNDLPNAILYFSKSFNSHDSSIVNENLSRGTDYDYLGYLLRDLFVSISFSLETGQVLDNWDNSDFSGPFLLKCDTCKIEKNRKYSPAEIYPYGIVSHYEDWANEGTDLFMEGKYKIWKKIDLLVEKNNYERPLKYLIHELHSKINWVKYYFKNDDHSKEYSTYIFEDVKDINYLLGLFDRIRTSLLNYEQSKLSVNLVNAAYVIDEIFKLPPFTIYPQIQKIKQSEMYIKPIKDPVLKKKKYEENLQKLRILLKIDSYDKILLSEIKRVKSLI